LFLDIKNIEKGLSICKKALAQPQKAPASPEREMREEPEPNQTLAPTDPRKRVFVPVGGKFFVLLIEFYLLMES
jgi:hypothetical protein